MNDKTVAALAASQRNRLSRAQIAALGCSDAFIEHRLRTGRWALVEDGVYAIAPVIEDRWGRWTGATLTAEETYLSHWSGGRAFEMLTWERELVSVTRHGSAGPVRYGGVLVYRRPDLAGEVGVLRGIPITSPERTLLDLAVHLSSKALARALREAIRIEHTTLEQVTDFLHAHPRRHGCRKLIRICAGYAGLPLERARSGAEIRALLLLRDAGRPLPELNVKVAGCEADLVYRPLKLIIEIDGTPFHQDVMEDARKEAAWRAAGYLVLRIPADDVYAHPERLLAIAP